MKPIKNPIVVNEIFRGFDEKLINDFSLISSQINHHGKKGEVREDFIVDFLKDHLPKKYSVSSGEIIDSLKNISHQCDIVIYDESNCPLIFSGKSYKIFPVEPIFATVEVKSRLSKTELIDCFEKTKKIKNLKRENGYVASVVIAYTTSFQKDGMSKLADLFCEISSSYKKYELIDLLFVIDSGFLILYNEHGICSIPKDFENRFMQCFVELEVPKSLWFLINLLDLLSNQESKNPEYISYMSGVEIGKVRVCKPQ